MRGVEVKHIRRKDVDLENVWDVESATGKGVLYIGHSKNETSQRKIPLNEAARDAITRVLKRADDLGHTALNTTSGARASTTTTIRRSRPRSGTGRGAPYAMRPAWQASASTTCATPPSPTCSRPVSPSRLSRP